MDVLDHQRRAGAPGAALGLRAGGELAAATRRGLPGPSEHRDLSVALRPDPGAGPVGALVSLIIRADDDSGSTTTVAALVVLAAHRRVVVRLTPPSDSFVRRTRLPVGVTSEGTAAADLALRASRGCMVAPQTLRAAPGELSDAEVRVEPPLLWWGPTRSWPVTLGWSGDDTGQVEAIVSQRAVLSPSLLGLVALMLVLVPLTWLVVTWIGG